MTDHSALIERLEETDPLRIDFTADRCEAAAALRDLTEWRDIATAPKDGTWVLVSSTEGRSVPACWCFSEVGFWATGIGGNLSDPSGPHKYLLHSATHWLPLPSAPNQAKEAGE